MKYPYIPILPLVNEVRDDLKRITQTSQFNEETLYGWAVDCMRMIGGHNYDKDEVFVTVNKYCAKTPDDFYLVDDIWVCKGAELKFSDSLRSDQEPYQWIKSNILRPANGETLKFCSRNCIKPGGDQQMAYTIKCPPGMMRFSFHTGKIALKYLKLPMQDGQFMIQDEINGLQAVKAYITVKLIKEKYIMNEINRGVYNDMEQEFNRYLNLAQQAQKFASPADTDYMALKQDARYRIFNYKRR